MLYIMQLKKKMFVTDGIEGYYYIIHIQRYYCLTLINHNI